MFGKKITLDKNTKKEFFKMVGKQQELNHETMKAGLAKIQEDVEKLVKEEVSKQLKNAISDKR